MNPVSWLALGIAFFKSIPDIVSLAKTVAGIVTSIGDYLNNKERLKTLHDALKDAHATGDTSKLEQFFSGRDGAAVSAVPPKLPNQPADPKVGS